MRFFRAYAMAHLQKKAHTRTCCAHLGQDEIELAERRWLSQCRTSLTYPRLVCKSVKKVNGERPHFRRY